MNKDPEFELEELVEELVGVYLPDSRLEELDEIVDMVPGALERLKSMKSEDDKLFYYEELCEIASKLEEFNKGIEIPN